MGNQSGTNRRCYPVRTKDICYYLFCMVSVYLYKWVLSTQKKIHVENHRLPSALLRVTCEHGQQGGGHSLAPMSCKTIQCLLYNVSTLWEPFPC